MTKVALITGADSGIGYASAEKLLDEGYIVYGGDIRHERMGVLEKKGLHSLVMDVRDEQQVNEGVATIIQEQGRIDGLLANAGYVCMGLFETVPMEQAYKQFETNVWGVARTIQAVLPHMRQAGPEGRGHIIIMSSGVGKLAMPGIGWYSASKHALEGLGDALRMEMQTCFPGIKVALVEPGFIPTNIIKHSLPTWDIASKSATADIYRPQLENVKQNFSQRTMDGSPVQTISDVVFAAFETASPKARYAPNLETRSGIFAEKFVEGSSFMDNIFSHMMLGDSDE